MGKYDLPTDSGMLRERDLRNEDHLERKRGLPHFFGEEDE
jgi:hypothetical protein